MAVTASFYGQALLAMGTGAFNLPTDPLNILLTNSTYTPNIDTHTYVSDLTGEITGTGYSRLALTGVSWIYDSTNHQCVLGAAQAQWTTATFTCAYAVIYKNTGTDTTSRLVSYVNLDGNRSPAGVDFIITFTNGVADLKVG